LPSLTEELLKLDLIPPLPDSDVRVVVNDISLGALLVLSRINQWAFPRPAHGVGAACAGLSTLNVRCGRWMTGCWVWAFGGCPVDA
jgi:hypothetical protein